MNLLNRPPDAIVTLNVVRYRSVTQGKMLTSVADPDVTCTLTQDAGGRVKQTGPDRFEVSGGDPQGKNPLSVQFRVLPELDYAAAGLIIENLHGTADNGSWDSVTVGSGTNDNTVTVTDRVRLPQSTPIEYRVYVFVRPKQAIADFPVGDVGLIDPLWSNR
jgi:hypothetical protein